MNKRPKLRFKGFEGEWEEKELGEYFTKVTTKNVNLKYTTVLTNSAELGIIPQSDFFNFEVANSNSIGNYYVVEPDDFVYNPRVSVSAPVGPIKRNRLGFTGIMSPLYLVFKIDNIDKDFLCYYYETDKWHQFMRLSGNSGARFDRISMSDETFVQMPIASPTLPEQRLIATCFTHLDTMIESSRQRVEKLKQVKAACLQAMFPQKGNNVPKIRFKGCEGEWKKVKLSSFAKRVVRKNTNLESTLALTIASAYGLIAQKDYFNNSVVGANISNYYLLKKGEFAYNKSYSNGYPFGSVKRLDDYEQGILSTLYIVFSIDESVHSDYICHFFDTNLWHKEVEERATEGARNHGLLNIGADDFLDIDILLPPTLPEQRKIAAFFTHLDTSLRLEQQRHAKLQQVKRASLTQMFV